MGDVLNGNDIQEAPIAVPPVPAAALNFSTIVGICSPAGFAGGMTGVYAARALSENTQDLTIPAEIQGSVGRATLDHFQNRPVEAVSTALVLGPITSVWQALAHKVADSPAVQTAAATAFLKVDAEVTDTAQKLAANPLIPGVILGKKGLDLTTEAVKADMTVRSSLFEQAMQDVQNLPTDLKEFDDNRPVTAAIIDTGVTAASGVLHFTGIDTVISTTVKGAAQAFSNRANYALKWFGIRE